MAIREITYTLSPSGISPAAEQFGGIQGDHRATKLIFEFSNDLWEKLKPDENGNYKAVYRFDCCDGEGNEFNSDTQKIENNRLEYYLEEWLTLPGGRISVTVVCTVIKDESEVDTECYTSSAKLRLVSGPRCNEPEPRRSMITMLESAKNVVGRAETVAIKGEKGEYNGSSVTVSEVEESREDDGFNKVTFSDGNIIEIKNGSQGPKGDKGDKGDSYNLTDNDITKIAKELEETINAEIEAIYAVLDEVVEGGISYNEISETLQNIVEGGKE